MGEDTKVIVNVLLTLDLFGKYFWRAANGDFRVIPDLFRSENILNSLFFE
jgi:hypothetical protein